MSWGECGGAATGDLEVACGVAGESVCERGGGCCECALICCYTNVFNMCTCIYVYVYVHAYVYVYVHVRHMYLV